ncbi:hypothetical protein BGZ60DRAFT_423711 [Tricladium varicosporioides]|nr:hypothetical protein BGZ60DRAFT_423711 [Hymenoscyphus varicosporioides]
MCGGGGKANSPGPEEAIRIHTIGEQPRRTESSRAASRQGTRHDRPPTKHQSERPSSKHTSHRPSSKRSERPPSASRAHRPSSSVSSSRDPRPTSKRRPSSSTELGGRRHDTSHRRGNFDTIEEDPVNYTTDDAIIRRVSELQTSIEQHVENFYDLDRQIHSGNSELDDTRTRQAMIRRNIAKAIIDDIILRSNTDIRNTAAGLAAEFQAFAFMEYNAERQSHLYDLCTMGMEIRAMISSHPSSWEFGEWEDVRGPQRGYVLVFPTLLQDEEQAVARRVFRT